MQTLKYLQCIRKFLWKQSKIKPKMQNTVDFQIDEKYIDDKYKKKYKIFLILFTLGSGILDYYDFILSFLYIFFISFLSIDSTETLHNEYTFLHVKKR